MSYQSSWIPLSLAVQTAPWHEIKQAIMDGALKARGEACVWDTILRSDNGALCDLNPYWLNILEHDTPIGNDIWLEKTKCKSFNPPAPEIIRAMEVNGEQFGKLFLQQEAPRPAKKPRDMGGAPTKYPWNDFDREMLRIANLDGLMDGDEGKHELVQKMLKWVDDHWKELPDNRQIRQRVADKYPN